MCFGYSPDSFFMFLLSHSPIQSCLDEATAFSALRNLISCYKDEVGIETRTSHTIVLYSISKALPLEKLCYKMLNVDKITYILS